MVKVRALNWVVLAAFGGIMLGACMSSSVARDKHAEFYGCKADDVTLKEVEVDGETQMQTSGCGHEDAFVCFAAKCRSPHILVIRHHSNTTQCANSEVTATPQGGDIWAASGCGKNATYRCVDDDKQLIRCELVK